MTSFPHSLRVLDKRYFTRFAHEVRRDAPTGTARLCPVQRPL